MNVEALTNLERGIADAADLALHEVQEASNTLAAVESILASRGVGTARILLVQAQERLTAAISYLPET